MINGITDISQNMSPLSITLFYYVLDVELLQSFCGLPFSAILLSCDLHMFEDWVLEFGKQVIIWSSRFVVINLMCNLVIHCTKYINVCSPRS